MIHRCPNCLGCKYEDYMRVTGKFRKKYQAAMSCGCGLTVYSDFHRTPQDAIDDLHRQRMMVSVSKNGLIDYDQRGEILGVISEPIA